MRTPHERANIVLGKKKETLVKPVTSVKNPRAETWEAEQQRNDQQAKARDTVGEKVGVSGKTAGPSAFCVRRMDAPGRIGKTLEAQPIRCGNYSGRTSGKPTGSLLRETGNGYSSTGTIW